MRYLSWFLSFLLHATVAVVLLQTIQMAPLELKDIMEVELTELETPEEIIVPMPTPPPPPPEPLPMETDEPVAAIAPAVLPQDKTIVLDDSPPPPPEPVAELEPEPAPPVEPDVVEISPKKVPVEPEEEKPTKKIIVRKDDTIVHRGHEARFGRSMMADYYSYEPTEFSGQFTARDDRTISIIDARNTKYGRFLIYDSKNKTLRRLKQVFKYVYTIGPSVYEDEPVIGSVTFLAKNDRIERFILQTDDDRIAHYPRKIHVREEEIAFHAADGERTAYLSLPPSGNQHPGVVFVHGNECVDPGLIQGVTRALSMRQLASMSFLPSGCNDENGEPESMASLVHDTSAALDHFTHLPQMQNTSVGLWGRGPGVPVTLSAVVTGAARPAFIVCMVNDDLSQAVMPGPLELARLDLPVLWLITGRETDKWLPLISTLEALRDRDKKPFTIVVAPLKGSREVMEAETDQSGWVENVTEDHARLAVSWIRSLDK